VNFDKSDLSHINFVLFYFHILSVFIFPATPVMDGWVCGYFITSRHPGLWLGSWTYGHLGVHVLTPSFHISGFIFSSTCISVANLFSLGFVFDSGFGVVLELNNTLQLSG
jgi:hypothetical protein